jgi:hypothetical protein
MADDTGIPIILHPGGVNYADQKHYGQYPDPANTGAPLARAPIAGSFIAMCALPGMFTANGSPKFGYLTLLKKGATDTRANKVRLIITDHPDST